jgi:probable F420-dependent oxidoreductase
MMTVPLKVRFGIGLGTTNVLGEPDVFAGLVDGLEEQRFDSLWISERATGPTLDPLTALAFAAGRTNRLKLGTSVLVVPGRNPVLLAKELATVDVLSRGRLLPAFGLGTPDPREHQAFGVDRAERGAWFEEAVPLIRRLWREDTVSHGGPRFPLTDVSLWPKPVGRMEVWLGGRTPREFDRAGRHAQGWLGGFQTPEDAGQARRAIEEAAARHGRTVDDDHYGTVLLYARGAIDPRIRERIARVRADARLADVVPTGAAELDAIVHRYVDQGISKFVLVPAARPAAWDDELAWLSPIVREFEAGPLAPT